MPRLTHRQYSRLSQSLLDLYTLRNREAFVTHTLTSFHDLIGCDLLSYMEINLKRKMIILQRKWAPEDVALREETRPAMERAIPQFPALSFTLRMRGERSIILSDFVPMAALKKSDLYHDLLKKLDTKYVLGSTIEAKPTFLTPYLFLREHRDFTTDHRILLDVLHPHLVQTFRNASAVTQMQDQLAVHNQALEDADQALVSVTVDGRIRFASPSAQKLLQQYGLQLRGKFLHPELRNWVLHTNVQFESSTVVSNPVQPLVIEGKRGALHLRLLRNEQDRLLLLEENRPQSQRKALAHLGLSPRETEILEWLVQGKTNPEIGMILQISPRTVQKHLEHIYCRLSVENRHAAITLALSSS